MTDAPPTPLPADTRGIIDPATMARHVTLNRYPAGEVLDGLVDWFWAVAWQLPEGIEHVQQVLNHPSGHISVGTTDDSGASREHPAGRVYGLITRISHRRLTGDGWTVAAKTTTGGLGALIDRDARRVTDRALTLDDALGLDGAQLVARIAGLDDEPTRIAVLREALEGVAQQRDPQRLDQAREVARVARIAETDRSVLRVEQLAAAAGTRHPVSVTLDGLGRYRVMAAPGRRPGNTLVIGLSMRALHQTLARVALIFAVVTALALAVAALAGIWVIRRALAPLDRVAATAGAVADLPLDRGEVALPVRVAEVDANPHTEVGRLGLAVNRMLDHISAALSTRQASESRVRQFVADASHELRTPLAAIRGYTELAQRKRAEVPADVAHAMSRVESEAERMTHLVEDLLLLARLDSGRPLERQPVDLARLCADVVGDAHAAGPEHRWTLEVPEQPVVVPGDDARLHQVVANLLANARVHTPAGSSVTLSLQTDDGDAVLRVCDDGPGVPAELQSEVFERFARADTSRSRKEGSTGLGLAIVSAVVRAHHGSIALESAPGRTVFTVRLPQAFAAVPSS